MVEVNYFSAIPNNDHGDADRQDLFFSANKMNVKFNLHLGKFLKKDKICKHCKGKINSYEEKETDVHIATHMIRDCVLKKCNISILISADSDLIPPINFIREYDPFHRVFVYFPPNRDSYDLKNKANFTIKLDSHQEKFEKSILPDEVTLPTGYVIKRPAHWI